MAEADVVAPSEDGTEEVKLEEGGGGGGGAAVGGDGAGEEASAALAELEELRLAEAPSEAARAEEWPSTEQYDELLAEAREAAEGLQLEDVHFARVLYFAGASARAPRPSAAPVRATAATAAATVPHPLEKLSAKAAPGVAAGWGRPAQGNATRRHLGRDADRAAQRRCGRWRPAAGWPCVPVQNRPVVSDAPRVAAPAGVSKAGLPTFVFTPANLSELDGAVDGAELEALLHRMSLYCVLAMDDAVAFNYEMIYVHTQANWFSRSRFGWIKRFYGTLPRKYKKNLAALHVVHPTRMLRTLFFLCRPFISKKFWKKLTYVDGVEQLVKSVGPDIVLPDIIVTRDRRTSTLEPMAAVDILQAMQAANNFAVPLETMMSRLDADGEEYWGLPYVLRVCVRAIETWGLDAEGVYRESGERAEVDALVAAFEGSKEASELAQRVMDLDAGPDDGDGLTNWDLFAVADCLKRWLRDLPDALITQELYDELMAVAEDATDEPESLDEGLRAVLLKLPECNRIALKFLCAHLADVADHEEANKMSPYNLAVCITPNIVRAPDDYPLDDQVSDMNTAITLVTALIVRHETVLEGTPTLSSEPDTGEVVWEGGDHSVEEVETAHEVASEVVDDAVHEALAHVTGTDADAGAAADSDAGAAAGGAGGDAPAEAADEDARAEALRRLDAVASRGGASTGDAFGKLKTTDEDRRGAALNFLDRKATEAQRAAAFAKLGVSEEDRRADALRFLDGKASDARTSAAFAKLGMAEEDRKADALRFLETTATAKRSGAAFSAMSKTETDRRADALSFLARKASEARMDARGAAFGKLKEGAAEAPVSDTVAGEVAAGGDSGGAEGSSAADAPVTDVADVQPVVADEAAAADAAAADETAADAEECAPAPSAAEDETSATVDDGADAAPAAETAAGDDAAPADGGDAAAADETTADGSDAAAADETPADGGDAAAADDATADGGGAAAADDTTADGGDAAPADESAAGDGDAAAADEATADGGDAAADAATAGDGDAAADAEIAADGGDAGGADGGAGGDGDGDGDGDDDGDADGDGGPSPAPAEAEAAPSGATDATGGGNGGGGKKKKRRKKKRGKK